MQVKATKSSVKNSRCSVSIRKELLRKWLLDTNLVFLVVWSIADEMAYFALPSRLLSLSDISDSNAKTIKIPIDSGQILSSSAVKTIAWIARLKNMNHQFAARTLVHQGLYKPSFESVAEYTSTKESVERDLTELVIQFLIFLGLLIKNQGAYDVNTAAFLEEMIYFGSASREAINKGEKIDLEFEHMCLLAIMLRAGRIMPGVGLPEGFLEKSTKFYSAFIEDLVRTGVGQSKRTITSMVRSLWKLGAQFEPGTELDALVAGFELPKF